MQHMKNGLLSIIFGIVGFSFLVLDVLCAWHGVEIGGEKGVNLLVNSVVMMPFTIMFLGTFMHCYEHGI
jgi:hypothetical protein